MTTETAQRIRRRWFAEWLPDPPMFGRASSWLSSLIDHKPEKAWEFVVGLIDDAPTEHAIECVAAGPLEDLLCDHGELFIDRVEALAAVSPRFKHSLGMVWGHIRMAPSIYGRVQCAAGRVPGGRSPQ